MKKKPARTEAVWIACHDTLVCMGAKKIQKWCVREGDEKGPLVAVMLTKDVAHALAACPEMGAALVRVERLIKEAISKFNWGASALDANALALLNEVPREVHAALAKARRDGTWKHKILARQHG